MKAMAAWIIGAVCITLILAGGEASAQGDEQAANRKKLKWDGLKMVGDLGGMTVGVFTLNPVVFGLSTASLGVHSYQFGRHAAGAQSNPSTSTAPTETAPTGSLVAIPGRPGYFYYPSNPNQLYYDANAASAAATPEPMQARLPEPARIKVLIANTAKDGRAVRYSVSGTDYEVPAGYIQALDAPAGSIIAYDRGDKLGTEKFLLTTGTYEFRTAEQGWRFYATNPDAANLARAKAKADADAAKPAVVVR